MYVAGRLISVNGSPRRRGDPIPEAADYRDYVLKAALSTGEILDVSTDVAAGIQLEEICREAFKDLQMAERRHREAEENAGALHVAALQALEVAQAAEDAAKAAADRVEDEVAKVAAARAKYAEALAARDGATGSSVPDPAPSRKSGKKG